MSLNFDVSKIENYKENYPRKEIDTWKANGEPTKMYDWHPVTETIVWGCMSTGIGQLKESNVAEWYARYTTWCRMTGLGADIIPFKHVVQHIGLHTNVFPEETRAHWLKTLGRRVDDIKREAEYNRSHDNDTYKGIKKEKVKQDAK